MLATAIVQIREPISLISLICGLYCIGLSILFSYSIVAWLWRIKEQRKDGLRQLREFTEQGLRIKSWLKEHIKELQGYPAMITKKEFIDMLNSKEFVDLINQDQDLYDRVLKIYPDYDAGMSPVELHRYFIELAEGKYKQTH